MEKSALEIQTLAPESDLPKIERELESVIKTQEETGRIAAFEIRLVMDDGSVKTVKVPEQTQVSPSAKNNIIHPNQVVIGN